MTRKGRNANNSLSGSITYPSTRVQLEQPRHNPVQSQNPPQLVQPRIGSIHTPSSSNLQDNEFDGDANIVTSSKKNTRGRTRMSHIWNLPEGEKIAITLNSANQPIKKNARSIADFLGTLARIGSLTPLNFNDWRYMPDTYKEDLWKIVTSKFDIPLRGENWVMKSLSKKWRDYKSELKGDFFEGKDPTEVYRNPPKEVIRSHWEYLVLYWCSAKGKELSQKNIRARGMQQFPHTSGSKPFAVVRDEMKESHPDKAEPTRTEVFMKTRKRKNGNFVDARSEEAIAQFNTLASQRADTPGDGTFTDDDFFEVMGEDPNGHARTYGLGVTPSSLCRKRKRVVSECMATESASSDEVLMLKEKFNNLEKSNEEMKLAFTKLISVIPDNIRDMLGLISTHSDQPFGIGQVTDTSNASENLPQPN